MAKSIVETLKQLLVQEGLEPNERVAMNWLRGTIEEMYGDKPIQPNRMIRNQTEAFRKFPGKMYMFRYVPKAKDTLPYYDEFPLVFILKPSRTGFLGMNMHYLPPKWRMIFLSRMDALRNNDKLDDTTRLRINYELIRDTSLLNIGLPIIKRYNNTNIRSKVVLIPADEWSIASLLPTEKFMKSSRATVWQDTRDKGLQ